MTRTLKKTVALVGMMGAGKSAVGKALAERLNVTFLDSDQEIEAASNLSIAEIFARYGELFFREKEAQVIERLLIGKPGILSTGGGAFLAEGNRKNMSELGVSVWLNAEPDVLWNRVKHKTTRPLLQTENPYQTLVDIYKIRAPIYNLADVQVSSDGETEIPEMVDRVIDVLERHDGIFEG
ncbi:MAG: shikimate kinase [Rhodobacteraceae bacterium]|nr:shikimate kinase [Paracoccaceae bacterium]